MNACDYGTPQNRKRWYCVGFRDDLNIGFENQKGDFKSVYKFPDKCELKFTVNDVVGRKKEVDYKVSDICMKNMLIDYCLLL